MTLKSKISTAEQTLTTVHDWIKSADQKVNIFLAFQGIVLTLLIPNYLKSITSRFQTHTMSLWNGFFILGAIVLLSLAIYSALNAILPRLGNKKIKSHLYFGAIAKIPLKQYISEMKNMCESDYLDELLSQIHLNSNIAFRKHKQFWNSIICFLVGMSFFVATYISLKFL